jgi:hypothetical protein
MALQLQGFSGVIDEVDATFRARRVTIRPPEVLSWISVGASSGALTGAAANSAVFSLRNIGTNLLIVRRVGVGFITTTAFTTAQIVDYGLMVARSFTVSDSGGTAITITGNNCKHRTSLATPSSLDCRISSTAALGAGTKTLDSNHLSQVGQWSGAAGAALQPAPNNLSSQDTGDYPVVLAQNEGINVMNLTAMGAAGVIKLYVNIEFAEATSY